MSFSLTQETLDYIDSVIPKYPEKRSAIMMLLHAIQREKGHLSLESQEWVAEKLELTPMQVREVVTFYPFYREHEVGKRYVRVCRTLSCALNGAYKVCDQFKDAFDTQLNEVSPDGRVTIEFAECLASCGTAPVVMVDDDLYENLDDAAVASLIQKIKDETPEVAETKEVGDGV